MQFTVSAVIVLALAVAARASVISLVNPGVPLQTVNINGVEGTAIAGLPSGVVIAGPGVWPAGPAVVGGWPWPGAVQVVPSPVQVVAPVPVVAAGASYVGQTRGAVHVAPLPGHSQSVSSVNLEPAPGTL